ncbi:MAG: hypothetical protein QOK31_230, partial [Solirubrobacteraceae bacterium]|nr:hypothetical protein [Solirubrobacteraceae bacterium]
VDWFRGSRGAGRRDRAPFAVGIRRDARRRVIVRALVVLADGRLVSVRRALRPV